MADTMECGHHGTVAQTEVGWQIDGRRCGQHGEAVRRPVSVVLAVIEEEVKVPE